MTYSIIYFPRQLPPESEIVAATGTAIGVSSEVRLVY